MHVISRKKLREFWQVHEEAEESLSRWFRIVEKADWSSFHDMGQTFGKQNVDKIGDCYAFDVGGNKYRVIGKVTSTWLTLFIKEVLTHREYDRGKWKKHCEE